MGLQRTPPQRAQLLYPQIPSAAAPPPTPSEVASGEGENSQLQPQDEAGPSALPPASPPPAPPAQTSEADKSESGLTTISLPTPSRAFIPRNPGVLRTPPGGHGALPPTSFATPRGPSRDVTMIQQEEEADEAEAAGLMEIDEPAPELKDQPQSESHHDDRPITGTAGGTGQRDVTPEPTIPQSTTPIAAPSASSIPDPSASASASASASTSAAAPTTPSSRAQPKTPRSRSRRQTVTLPDPPAPIQLDEPAEYGRRYQLTMETLDRAVKAGVQRWNVDTFKGCFPKLAEQKPKAMENVYHSTAQTMRSAIMNHAHSFLEHYKTGPALQAVDEVDKEAREYARAHPAGEGSSSRPDAWRPNISPHALVAATTLPIYDEAFAKLREEYLGLHQDITDRFASIRQKQSLLKEIEGNVSDGVVDLEKTIQVLDQMPVDDMSLWMETAETRLDTRAAERAA